MNKILIHILILVAFIPSMVCGMPVCDSPAQGSSLPSHCGDPDPIAPSEDLKSSPMLLADCGDLELATAAFPALQDQQLSIDFDYPAASQFMPLVRAHQTPEIRGSPNLQTGPDLPLYMSTHRLRI